MLVEHETGLSYFQSLKKLVFEPLGLTDFAEWEFTSEVVPGYELIALVKTSTWESAIEYTTEGFEQSEAIDRLRADLQV